LSGAKVTAKAISCFTLSKVIGHRQIFENQPFLHVYSSLVHSFLTYGQVIHSELANVNNLQIR